MPIIIFVLLLLPLPLFAVDVGQSDIPLTISSTGTYELTENITYADGNAITVTTSNAVVIRGKGGTKYSITCTGGHGIYSNNQYGTLTIYDLTINMNDANTCIYLANSTGSKSVTVHDVDMNISLDYGGEANGLWFTGGSATLTGSMYSCTVVFSGLYSGTNRSSAFAVTYPSSSAVTPFEICSNTITITGHLTNGIRIFSGDNFVIRNNTITADSGSDNTKSIQIDEGSDGCKVYSNNIDINASDSTGNSYGIRIRAGVVGNYIYSNTINVEDSTGSGSYGVALGYSDGSDVNGVLIHDNIITGKDGNIPAMLYNASGDGTGNDFYCNTLVNTGTGACVYFYPVTSATPVYNLRFSGDTMTTSGNYAIVMPAWCDEGSLDNVSFCGMTVNGSALTAGHVNDVDSVGGWSITSAPCAYSCDSSPSAASPASLSGGTISGGSFR